MIVKMRFVLRVNRHGFGFRWVVGAGAMTCENAKTDGIASFTSCPHPASQACGILTNALSSGGQFAQGNNGGSAKDAWGRDTAVFIASEMALDVFALKLLFCSWNEMER